MSAQTCPVCERPVPTFEAGEVGPFCTPITCPAWKVAATFDYGTRQWVEPPHIIPPETGSDAQHSDGRDGG